VILVWGCQPFDCVDNEDDDYGADETDNRNEARMLKAEAELKKFSNESSVAHAIAADLEEKAKKVTRGTSTEHLFVYYRQNCLCIGIRAVPAARPAPRRCRICVVAMKHRSTLVSGACVRLLIMYAQLHHGT
jgi:hypothetical protein